MKASFVTTLRVVALVPTLSLLPGFVTVARGDTAAPAAAPAFDQAPHALVTLMPVVPDDVAAKDGQVLLALEVNAAGYVTRAEVKSCTVPGLAQPCVDVVKRWRYTPALLQGKPVAAKFIQPIDFSASGVMSAVELQLTSAPAKVISAKAPVLPDALKHLSGQAVVAATVDDHGKVADAAVVSSSHEELNGPCLEAIRRWTFAPRTEGGKPVATKVQVPFRFVGDPMAAEDLAQAANARPAPIRQPGLELPDSLAKASGEAEIEFVVDRNGFVTNPTVKSATNPAYGELARKNVLGWKFQPAMKDGHAVAVRVIQPFRFNESVSTTDSKDAIDRLPLVKNAVQPVLPQELRNVLGRVLVEFSVDAHGIVTAVRAKESTHAELAGPALDAAKQWTFVAAVKNGQPAAATVAVPFIFGS